MIGYDPKTRSFVLPPPTVSRERAVGMALLFASVAFVVSLVVGTLL